MGADVHGLCFVLSIILWCTLECSHHLHDNDVHLACISTSTQRLPFYQTSS